MSESTGNGSAHVFVTDGPMSRAQAELATLHAALAPLCPCDPNPATTGGPQQDCPLHGDGVTFVDHVQRLENLAMAARDLRTQDVYYALNPERPVWRRFADAVTSLDGAS